MKNYVAEFFYITSINKESDGSNEWEALFCLLISELIMSKKLIQY